MEYIQEVEVYVKISGEYCAFHEIMFSIVYDITNNKQLGYYSRDELKNWEYEEYSDCELRDAVLIDGVYYVEW